MKKNEGFTLLELMLVVSVIVILMSIITASIYSVRSRARDAQARSEKNNLVLALVKAREASPTFSYPGTPGVFQCIKASGTCWQGVNSGNTTVSSAVTPYLPGGVIPIPYGRTNEYRGGGYSFNPGPYTSNGYTGAFLVWSQEKPINNADCPGYNAGKYADGIYYCYELLPR